MAKEKEWCSMETDMNTEVDENKIKISINP